MDIMYYNWFQQLKVLESTLAPHNFGEVSQIMQLDQKEWSNFLCVSAKRRLRWGVVPFLEVDLPSPYNKIIWQPTLTSLGAVISIDCVSMNFLHKEASGSRLEIRISKKKSQLRRYHKRRKSEESWNRYAWIAHGGRWCKITCREAEKDTFVQRE